MTYTLALILAVVLALMLRRITRREHTKRLTTVERNRLIDGVTSAYNDTGRLTK